MNAHLKGIYAFSVFTSIANLKIQALYQPIEGKENNDKK